ncbi:MAG: RNA methyltransferase [Actinomycetota bacterium]
MISSLNNATVKATAKLAKRRERDRRRMFLVEGHRATTVALASGISVPLLFYTPAARKRTELLDGAALSGSKMSEVSPAVMRHLTTHAHPPDVLAVATQRPATAKKAAAGAFLVVLSGVKDPAVAGGILSAAAGAGATGVIVLEGSTDVFAPAAARAAAGAHFILPIARDIAPADAVAACGSRALYALTEQGRAVCSASMNLPLALVVCESGVPAEFAHADCVAVPSGVHGCGPGLGSRAAISIYQVTGSSPASGANR